MRNTYDPTGSDAEKEISAHEQSLLIKRKTIGFIGAGVACSIFSFGAFYLSSVGKNGSIYTAWGPAGNLRANQALQDRFKPFDEKPALTDEPARYKSDARSFEQSKPIPLPAENGGVTKPLPRPSESQVPRIPNENGKVQYWMSSANVSPSEDRKDVQTMADAMPSYRQVHMSGYRMDRKGDVRIEDENFHREFPERARSKNRSIQIFATVQSPSDADNMERLIQTPEARSSTVRKLSRFVQEHRFHGLNLELAELHSGNLDDFSRFCEELAQELHRQGKKLAVTFKPHLFRLDSQPDAATAAALKNLGASADEIKVVQERSNLNRPGPIAPLARTDRVLAELKKYVPAHKAYADYQAIAAHWANDDLMLLSTVDVLPVLDKLTGKAFRDKNGELYSVFSLAGIKHVIYCQDRESMEYKMLGIRRKHRKLGGVFIDLSQDRQQSDTVNKLLNLFGNK